MFIATKKKVMMIGYVVFIAASIYVKETNGHDLGVDCVVAIPETSFILDRISCPKNNATHDRLQEVRALFDSHNIDAYIITIEDVHMQFTTSLHDKRLQAVSGFSGVIGLGVVTRSTAALWTDGRTFIQATEEVDCGWEIYRKGGPNTTSVTDWIKENVGDHATIGASPSYMYSVWWKNFDFVLSKYNLALKAIEPDLVDEIWTSDRPPQPSSDINVLDIKYAGRKWEDKLRDIREDMTKLGVDVLVTTGLDEIAWLYNIRARDIEYEPYPYAFSIVQHQTTSLYIMDSKSKLSRPSSDPESLVTLKEHLKTNNDGQCSRSCVKTKEYNHSSFTDDIVKIAGRKDIRKIMVSFSCNYKIYASIPEEKVYQGIPPTLAHKARKNDVERMGMRHAVLVDSVKLISLFARIEKEVSQGIPWTVYKATIEAIRVRRELDLYRDESFLALAGSGISTVPLLAYPVENASRQLATTESFLMDSGGQYLDGTSDLTRTFHYGIPSDHEQEIYTRVLMAHLNLAMHKFPVGRTGMLHLIDTTHTSYLLNKGLKESSLTLIDVCLTSVGKYNMHIQEDEFKATIVYRCSNLVNRLKLTNQGNKEILRELQDFQKSDGECIDRVGVSCYACITLGLILGVIVVAAL